MGRGQLLNWTFLFQYITKHLFWGAFYCTILLVTQRWTRDQLNQFTNCPLFSPLLLISSIIDDVHQIHSKMITLEITIEEAKAYAAALDRALDNPFIQDDDECSPLFTLSGKLDGAIDAVLDPVV